MTIESTPMTMLESKSGDIDMMIGEWVEISLGYGYLTRRQEVRVW